MGCEIALWANGLGHSTTLIERLPELMSAGPLVAKENKQMTIDLLNYQGVNVFLNTTVGRVDHENLHLVDGKGNTTQMECDTLVIAVGMTPDQRLFSEADRTFKRVRRIGDCLKPRNIQGAIWDAYEVARRV